MDNKTRSLTVISVLAMLILAACGPQAIGIPEEDETSTPTASPTLYGATEAPFVTLRVSSNAALGSFLTDQIGMTLYSSKNDAANTTHCAGACIATWPALITSGSVTAGDKALKGKVGVINRPDGGQQVTYNGLPLYYYAKDNIPGDANGVGVDANWSVVKP